MQSAAKPQKLSRPADFELLTRAVKAELADEHWSAAIGSFRETVNLSRGLPDLEEAAVRLGIELAREILPLGSRLAKSLLQEASAVDSGKIIPAELWDSIREQEREEAITGALNCADPASFTSLLPAVRRRLSMLLEQYPEEPRLLTRLKSLPPQEVRAEIASPARHLEASSGSVPIRGWTQTLQANRSWLSTAATLIFSVLAVGTAVGLLWMNQATHRPQHTLKKMNADDQAWSSVNPRSADLVESYLMRFPAGAHRGQAVQALIQIRIGRRQSAEVRERQAF